MRGSDLQFADSHRLAAGVAFIFAAGMAAGLVIAWWLL
jgi:tetrahydromethanopterin S-methyltransferase subunit F